MAKSGSKKGVAKGGGYIYQRRKGGSYYLEYTINGNRKSFSLKTKNKEVAEKKRDEILSPLKEAKTKEQVALHIGEARNLITKSKIKLSEIWDVYLKSPARPKASEKTLKDHEYRLNRFLGWLYKKYPSVESLAQVDDKLALKYAENLQGEKLSPKTYNAHLASLKLITRVLSRQAGIVENPWDGVTKQELAPHSHKEFSEEQVLAILESFDNSNLNIMHKEEARLMFHLGAWTGLRLKDCALLKWENIEFERNIISCIPHKTKRFHRVVNIPMHPMLREELEKAMAWKENDYLLPKIAHRYNYNKSGVQKDAIKILQFNGFETSRDAGSNEHRAQRISQYGFHSFRHSFVSFCAKNNVPLPVVESIVGHGNPAITRHYVHIGEDSIQKAIEALPMGTKSLPVDSPNQKLIKIREILESADKLSERERKILDIIK
jgi:integrase